MKRIELPKELFQVKVYLHDGERFGVWSRLEVGEDGTITDKLAGVLPYRAIVVEGRLCVSDQEGNGFFFVDQGEENLEVEGEFWTSTQEAAGLALSKFIPKSAEPQRPARHPFRP